MTAKFSFVSVAALAVLPLPFACGGDDGPTHVTTHDAAVNNVDAAEACAAATSYSPTFSASNLVVNNYPATGSGSAATLHHMYFTGGLTTDTPPDELSIDLWEKFGGFGSGDIKTGSYTLTGEDAAFSTCGTCVYLATDSDATNGPAGYYFAQGGVLNLTSVTGRLTGTLTNVTFVKVGVDPDGFPLDEPAPGNCTSTIASASFDSVIGSGGSGSATGKFGVKLERPGVLHHRYQ